MGQPRAGWATRRIARSPPDNDCRKSTARSARLDFWPADGSRRNFSPSNWRCRKHPPIKTRCPGWLASRAPAPVPRPGSRAGKKPAHEPRTPYSVERGSIQFLSGHRATRARVVCYRWLRSGERTGRRTLLENTLEISPVRGGPGRCRAGGSLSRRRKRGDGRSRHPVDGGGAKGNLAASVAAALVRPNGSRRVRRLGPRAGALPMTAATGTGRTRSAERAGGKWREGGERQQKGRGQRNHSAKRAPVSSAPQHLWDITIPRRSPNKAALRRRTVVPQTSCGMSFRGHVGRASTR